MTYHQLGTVSASGTADEPTVLFRTSKAGSETFLGIAVPQEFLAVVGEDGTPDSEGDVELLLRFDDAVSLTRLRDALDALLDERRATIPF